MIIGYIFLGFFNDLLRKYRKLGVPFSDCPKFCIISACSLGVSYMGFVFVVTYGNRVSRGLFWLIITRQCLRQ